jgi:hypothetical protein
MYNAAILKSRSIKTEKLYRTLVMPINVVVMLLNGDGKNLRLQHGADAVQER